MARSCASSSAARRRKRSCSSCSRSSCASGREPEDPRAAHAARAARAAGSRPELEQRVADRAKLDDEVQHLRSQLVQMRAEGRPAGRRRACSPSRSRTPRPRPSRPSRPTPGAASGAPLSAPMSAPRSCRRACRRIVGAARRKSANKGAVVGRAQCRIGLIGDPTPLQT